MDTAARTRQRILALFLPIAAVLYISAEALALIFRLPALVA